MASNNPYLQGMADDISRRSNLGLQQGLQGIRSNSVMGGGLGGSRQGVAEGAAISNTTDSLQGNLANMYNTDYQAGQNRDVQRYGIDSQSASAKYGADSSLRSSMYGADQSLAASIYGADTSRGIATMNNATTRIGQDQNYDLGLKRDVNDGRNATTNATNVDNQYKLGTTRNEQDALNARNQYDINLGQNAVAAQNADSQARSVIYQNQVAGDRNAIDRQSNQDNLGIKRAQQQQDATNSDRTYDINLRNSDLGFSTLDANTAQNTFNNKVTAINVGNNAHDRVTDGDGRAVTAATNIQNTPKNYYADFANTANTIGGNGSTTNQTATAQGNPVVGAAGGAVLGQNLVKNLGFGNSDMAMTNGGGFTNMPNYMIRS